MTKVRHNKTQVLPDGGGGGAGQLAGAGGRVSGPGGGSVGWVSESTAREAASPGCCATWVMAGGDRDLNTVSDSPDDVWRKLYLPQCRQDRVAPEFQENAAPACPDLAASR